MIVTGADITVPGAFTTKDWQNNNLLEMSLMQIVTNATDPKCTRLD